MGKRTLEKRKNYGAWRRSSLRDIPVIKSENLYFGLCQFYNDRNDLEKWLQKKPTSKADWRYGNKFKIVKAYFFF